MDSAKKSFCTRGAAITQWNRLRLPSCRPRFESQAQHVRFIDISQICAIFCICIEKGTKLVNVRR